MIPFYLPDSVPREQEVLDKGFVKYMAHMGSDRMVARAAWVSTDRADGRTDGEVAKVIQYMASHKHVTPFMHPQLTLYFKMPLFVARQWMRSNVGIAYNEESRRYVDSTPDFYEPKQLRKRKEGVKQGSADAFVEGNRPNLELKAAHDSALLAYDTLLEDGVAPEQARMVLPQSMYTEFWQTASLAAWARVYGLRADKHAQWEAQQYADAVGGVASILFPVSWKALTDATDPA